MVEIATKPPTNRQYHFTLARCRASISCNASLVGLSPICDTCGIQHLAGFLGYYTGDDTKMHENPITGFIDISAFGSGSLETMKVSLTSKSGGPLEITVSPGTIFDSQSSLKSSMVVTREKKISIEPHQTSGLISIDAVSLNMWLDVPAGSDALTLNTSSTSGDLRKLVRLSVFQNEPSFRVQQFAIWTITDNPGRNEYVGIGYFGMGSGPSEAEIERIRVLFQEAGIPTDKYKALG